MRTIPYVAFALSIAVLLFLVVCAASDAATEYCPVSIATSHAIGSPAASEDASAQATVYSFSFKALSARSVAVLLRMHTDDGWYSADVPPVALRPYEEHWSNGNVRFKRTDFYSGPIYVRFQKPEALKTVYVDAAQTTGETIFGWDKKGRVSCVQESFYAPNTAKSKPLYAQPTSGLEFLNRPDAYTERPSSTATVVNSVITNAPPTNGACQTPWSDGGAVALAPITFTSAAANASVQEGSAYVEVALSADGTPDDAWIFAPSGNQWFDDAAVRAAKLSTFTPKRLNCESVPATYLVRFEF